MGPEEKIRNVTELMAACQENDLDKVSNLLEKGVNTGESDSSGKVALHYSAEHGSGELVQKVIDADRSLLDHKDHDGYTPMNFAIIGGNSESVDVLIDNKAEVNVMDNEKHSLVHWATVCGQKEILEKLLLAGALPSTPDLYGCHSLHYATQLCGADELEVGKEIIKILLKHNANVNCADQDERTPLLWAASAGSCLAINLLLEFGADRNSVDKDLLTALHCAASRGHDKVIELLLSSPEKNTEVKDKNGCTPLFYAVTLGHVECVRVLLELGANPNAQDKKLRTAAHCGASKGQLKALKILHKYGASFNLINHRGDLPISEAIHCGSKELIQWLLDLNPLDIKSYNYEGRGPLHLAVAKGNVKLCAMLVERGADVNCVMLNKQDMLTPLDIAVRKGYKEIIAFLESHGAQKVSDMPNDIVSEMRQSFMNNRSIHQDLRMETGDSGVPTDILAMEEMRQRSSSLVSNSLVSNNETSGSGETDTKVESNMETTAKKPPVKKTKKVRKVKKDSTGINRDSLAPLKNANRSQSYDSLDSQSNRGQSDSKSVTITELSPLNSVKNVAGGKLSNGVHIRFKDPGTAGGSQLALANDTMERQRAELHYAMRSSLKRYMEEKRIFQELANLKRMQIQYEKVQEDILVRDMVQEFMQGYNVKAGDFQFLTFSSWEKFLYDQLKFMYMQEQKELKNGQRNKDKIVLKKKTKAQSLFDEKLKRMPRRDEGKIDQLFNAYGSAPLPLTYTSSSRMSSKLPPMKN